MSALWPMLQDFARAFVRAPLPTLALYTALTLIAGSLAATQAITERWQQVRALGLSVPLATLGQYAPDGSLKPVAARELQAFARASPELEVLSFMNATVSVTVAVGAEQRAQFALVSPEFHRLLKLNVHEGHDLEADPRGLILTVSGAARLFARPHEVVGQTLMVGDERLTVTGLTDADLLGIASPAIDGYLSPERASLIVATMPGLGLDAEGERRFREAIPIVYGFAVGRADSARERFAAAWQPPASAAIEIDLGSASPIPMLTLGFERRNFRPAVLPGLDLDPARTRQQQQLLLGLRLAALGAGLVLCLMLAQYLVYVAEASRFELRLRHALGAGPTRLCVEHVAVQALPLLLCLPLAMVVGWAGIGLIGASASFAGQPAATAELSATAIGLAVAFQFMALGAAALVSARTVWRLAVGLNQRARGRIGAGLEWAQTTVIAVLLCLGCMLTSSGALSVKQQLDIDPGAADRWLIRGGGAPVMQRTAAALAEAGIAHARVEHLPLSSLPLAIEYRLEGVAERTVIAGTNRMEASAPALLGYQALAGAIPERLAENQWIVNHAFADALGLDPGELIGRTLAPAQGESGRSGGQIVAVAKLLRHQRLHDAGEPVVVGAASNQALTESGFGLVVDLAQSSDLAPVLAGVDPSDLALVRNLRNAKSVQQVLAERTRFERSAAWLNAAAGLLFAVVGLVGLGSRLGLRTVQQRYALAVHRALGARSAELIWLSIAPVLAAGLLGGVVATGLWSAAGSTALYADQALADGGSMLGQSLVAGLIGFAALYALSVAGLAAQASATGHAELTRGER